jgi:glutathione synthase/RimK-type ligase-like ATP-grasp enzyme
MNAIILRRRKLGLGSCRGIKQFSQQGIDFVRNDKPIPQAQYVFRWGCTSNIPINTTVVNTAEAIHLVSDKAKFRMLTADAGLAPKTWLSPDDWSDDTALVINRKAIVRRATHHQGRFLDLVDNYRDMVEVCHKYGEGNYYISEYIPKVAEYRVFLSQERVVWVAKKTPADANAVAWNVAQGGRFDNVRWDEWPLRVLRVAREAFLLSKLDFGGVDVMVDEAGKVYVLEINSAPSQTSPYRQECTAKAFDYIIEHNSKAAIPVVEQKGGYLKFIHPAICNNAMMR